jgi:hypothetical protein
MIDFKRLGSTSAILYYLAIIKLLLPLFTHPDFELHRDEFLYLAMGDHLAWGYLEVPPAIGIYAWFIKNILGTGIFATRFLPALVGALTLLLTSKIAEEMGGGRFARILAAVCFLLSTIYLRINLLFQPVPFNLFFYVLAVYLFIE